MLRNLQFQRRLERQVCRITLTVGAILAGVSSAWSFDPASGDFDKPDPSLIRVMTWNVHNNFIYTSGKNGNYSRVIKAANPDIIAFQEIDVSLTAAQIEGRLESYFPGSSWHAYLGKADGGNAGVSNRNVIASRYTISMKRNDTIPSSSLRGVTMGLIDLPNGTYSKDLYIMSIHFKAGNLLDNHRSKQDHADAITNWMRDARNSGGNITLPNDTPMMVVGDFNFVNSGDKAPYHATETMLDGSIYDHSKYGASSLPDWDGTENSDAAPYDYNNAEPFTHSSSNPAGRIDRYYYTDSVIHPVNKFVFNTQTMTAAARTAAGNLLANDTSGASDHLPCVVDFAMGASAPGKLLVNEYCANDVGTDDRTFIELVNTSGEEINLDAPLDYWIKTSLPLPTSPPSSTNEEFAYDLHGTVPPGGLFVLYDGAGESASVKSVIESNLPKLQRQNNAGLMMRNQEYTGFALITRVVQYGDNNETGVEAYGYGAPNPNTTRYFELNSDNHRTITMGPTRWTDFLAGEVGMDLSASRNVGSKTTNNYATWTIGTADTPGQQNQTVVVLDNDDSSFNASGDWSTGTSASDKYGDDYRFRLTEPVSDVATWNFSVPLAGNYEIFAWWSQGANRSITAPYLLPDSSIVYKNQQTGGGAWQSLGTVSLSAGNHQVRLSCWTDNGTVVIGDAIKVIPN